MTIRRALREYECDCCTKVENAEMSNSAINVKLPEGWHRLKIDNWQVDVCGKCFDTHLAWTLPRIEEADDPPA